MTDDRMMGHVARNVRAARARLGLSLEKLGARAGVSKGALVALEGAAGNPNLATLVRLADALGVPVSALLEEVPVRGVRLVRDSDAAPLWQGAAGGHARLLLTTEGPAPVELWRWRLTAGETYDSHPHPAGFNETVTVVSGALTLVVDGAGHTVTEGTTAAFDADVPHSYRGAGPDGCDLLMTVHLPPAPAPGHDRSSAAFPAATATPSGET